MNITEKLIAAVHGGSIEEIKAVITESGLAKVAYLRPIIPQSDGSILYSQKIDGVKIMQQYENGTLFIRLTEDKEYGYDVAIVVFSNNTAEFQFRDIPF